MLVSLSIQDVVLIDGLAIDFGPGLAVLTGETGAGKSILLDALGLVLGSRAESRLVRKGAAQASVSALFDIRNHADVGKTLADHGIAATEDLVLRRVLTAEGRSRAFVDDQPVSAGMLRQIGDLLVEIHGQHETQGLLNPSRHRQILDAFIGAAALLADLRRAFEHWRQAQDAYDAAVRQLAENRREEEYLRHVAEELGDLDPQPGEEDTLAEKRTLMMQGEKIIQGLEKARTTLLDGDVEGTLRRARRLLETAAPQVGGLLDDAITALDRAAVEADESVALLESAAVRIDLDPHHLERVEERLFALRAAARKHNVAVDDLAALRDDFDARLNAIDHGAETVQQKQAAVAAARSAYEKVARALSQRRGAGAARLDGAVAGELAALKMDKARFATAVDQLPEDQWSARGWDRVAFLVATNPGADPGPLNKIASGGELARFMLALKVVLAAADPVSTLVFDEVDAGVGGAVAAAVGERLARLGRDVQVLVVTHSPQVAAQGKTHWRVAKSAADGAVATMVEALDETRRREEVARMLAGAEVTDAARIAAKSLLEAAGHG